MEKLSESFLDETLMREIGITVLLSSEAALHDFTMSPWGPRLTIASANTIGTELLTTIEITELEKGSDEILVNIQAPTTTEGAALYNAHIGGPRDGQSSVVRLDSHGQEVYRYEPSKEFALRLAGLAFKSIDRQNGEVAEVSAEQTKAEPMIGNRQK